MTKEIILPNRAIIEVKGVEAKNFLQGLISNDVNKIDAQGLIYAAMLSATGRFLYDFFAFAKNDSIFLDCEKSRRDEIFAKLKLYKLRTKIELIKNDEYVVAQDFSKSESADKNNLIFADPRNPALGLRKYKTSTTSSQQADLDFYNYQRICSKVAESEQDLTYEKSIIAEFGFDELHAIDYQKGCYIGQELTARTHYMGQIRKKIFHIKIEDAQNIAKNSEISCAGKNVGLTLSSVFFENRLHALALIKIEEGANQAPQGLEVEGKKIIIIN